MCFSESRETVSLAWWVGVIKDDATMDQDDSAQYSGGALAELLGLNEHSGIQTIKVFANEKGDAVIQCCVCGRKKIANVAAYQGSDKKLRVTCPCGTAFFIHLEWRRHYRKPVKLDGDYSRDGAKEEIGTMEVQDLSAGGLGMKIVQRHSLNPGDIVRVSFELDDGPRSHITRNAIVRNVNGSLVGAEFCDNKLDKALAFYVLP
jgi:hypothetical protein